ncbi:hypothetical protein NDS46_31245 (plasmid) [Paenibacillus thiaminolyticus]|uniref:hypothetical protein n=1 Tax=Paenibacillus thiaminolyticus TaxID=49283 RepID=UPI00232F38C2|nr:hypothetical protein [Paenibacillus thiaminolyticus]WCF11435.1 hypothetical protein NDS46_31245 [Paenibacillus thiaminolyticus]
MAEICIILLSYIILKVGFIALNESDVKIHVPKMTQRASFCLGTAIVALFF